VAGLQKKRPHQGGEEIKNYCTMIRRGSPEKKVDSVSAKTGTPRSLAKEVRSARGRVRVVVKDNWGGRQTGKKSCLNDHNKKEG